jgi:uncharacterized protein
MIYETIVTTRNPDNSIQIAPLGYREERGLIVLAPFRPSRTLENLQRTGQAVINITDNVTIIAGCLTGRWEWPTLPAMAIEGSRLEDVLTHLEVQVVRVEEDDVRPRFQCELKHSQTHAPFRGFNRAQAAVVEAAILVSRLTMLPPEKIDQEVAYLQIAIDKTAGERERLAWFWLMEKIQHFRQQQHES